MCRRSCLTRLSNPARNSPRAHEESKAGHPFTLSSFASSLHPRPKRYQQRRSLLIDIDALAMDAVLSDITMMLLMMTLHRHIYLLVKKDAAGVAACIT
jgi:hypothetical protein